MTKLPLPLLIIALVIAGVVFYRWSQQAENNTAIITATTTKPSNETTLAPVTAASAVSKASPTTDHPGMKLYRNEEFGFEFWYPEGWTWQENVFGNPSSKFNLVAHPGGTHPDLEPIIINIVTAAFADRQYQDLKKDGVTVFIDDKKATRYQYREATDYTDIVIPVGSDTAFIIDNEDNRYIDDFQQILSNFKFIK